MKKTLFLMVIIAALATGCNKSKNLDFKDTDPLQIALRDNYKVNVSSDYDITFTSANPLVVEPKDGKLYGKNVGSTQITMDNGYKSMTVGANVSLFIQPTFEFGCSSSRIKSLYGNPYQSGYNDAGTLVYVYTMKTDEGYYSWACGEMDFFFNDGKYIEADLYIRNGVDYLLENYLTENFNPVDTVYLHLTETDSVLTCLYRNKVEEHVILGKYPSGNQYNETLLFYYHESENRLDMPRKALGTNR